MTIEFSKNVFFIADAEKIGKGLYNNKKKIELLGYKLEDFGMEVLGKLEGGMSKEEIERVLNNEILLEHEVSGYVSDQDDSKEKYIKSFKIVAVERATIIGELLNKYRATIDALMIEPDMLGTKILDETKNISINNDFKNQIELTLLKYLNTINCISATKELITIEDIMDELRILSSNRIPIDKYRIKRFRNRVFQKTSYMEIAKELNLSLDTIKSYFLSDNYANMTNRLSTALIYYIGEKFS